MLDPLYTQYEKDFHANTYVTFAQNTWPILPLALCGLYALMIILGTKVMASRPKHEWKTALACWNLLLSVFSFCGMLRTVPHLLHNVATLPFKVGTSFPPSFPPSFCRNYVSLPLSYFFPSFAHNQAPSFCCTGMRVEEEDVAASTPAPANITLLPTSPSSLPPPSFRTRSAGTRQRRTEKEPAVCG